MRRTAIYGLVLCLFWLGAALAVSACGGGDDDATTNDDDTSADDDAATDDDAADDDATVADDDDSGGPMTIGEIESQIFAVNCAPCHITDSRGGLSLSAGNAYDNLVSVESTEAPGVFRVKPGDADNSYLVAKLEGRQTELGGSGGQMPLGRTPLDQQTIDAIRAWIDAGAAEN